MQFDPPDDPRDYIHRVGRTARAGKVGKSLLFLLESELGFLRYLKEAKVPLNEFSFPADKIANVQSQVWILFCLFYFSYTKFYLAREATTEKLFPSQVCERRVPSVFTVVCFVFTEKDFRREPA